MKARLPRPVFPTLLCALAGIALGLVTFILACVACLEQLEPLQ